ncbi:hypothetical protein [Ekhidna sp.]|uniref:hypothetical protein n=1 Tax=Ekhidna sp. TaxID=2608089 RepID=UPI003299EA8C
MRNVNFDLISEQVGTQYGDVTGVIQIDGHSNIQSIYQLCEDHDFETDGKFIIGFGMSDSGIKGIGGSDKVGCKILFLSKEDYGSSFDDINSQLRNLDETVTVYKKTLYVEYKNLGKYLKRFDFLATSELFSNMRDIEIEEL